MRVALISLSAQPLDRASGLPATIGGKSVARRQLGFALAAGCRKIIALGAGASADALALRHAAEAVGARFQQISSAHGLLGAVKAADELLVLAPALLPEDPLALELLEKANTILVLPSGIGVAAGFERIDLVRAWAGAMVVPGSLVERLAELPEDSDAHAALLRLALQAQLAERRLSEAAVGEGTWVLVGADNPSEQVEASWLKRHLPGVPFRSPSHGLARLILSRAAPRLLAASRSLPAVLALSLILVAGAFAAAFLGFPGPGFGMLTLAALSVTFCSALEKLGSAPYLPERRWTRPATFMPPLIDLALFCIGVLAIPGDWVSRVFPPLTLIATLYALDVRSWPNIAGSVSDRAVLALAFAVAAPLGAVEQAVMLAVLLLLFLAIIFRSAEKGG